MANLPAVPGLLFSNTRISRPDILTEAAYLKWYFEEHIPDDDISATVSSLLSQCLNMLTLGHKVIKTGAVDAGLFYKNVERVDKPYLALYPLRDITFMGSEEFKKIRVTSENLPGTGICYDVMEADVRYYKQIQVFGPEGKILGDGKCLVLVGTEPSDSVTAIDFDAWYRRQHLELLSKIPGYLRTIRYELTFSRTNLESKILKGYATEEEKANASSKLKPPAYLVLHEFDTLQLPVEELKDKGMTEWSSLVLTGVNIGESATYKLEHKQLKK